MSNATKMSKRDAHELAERLGLEVEKTETAEQVVEEIQQAVDEWAILVAESESAEDDLGGARALLEMAVAAGFEPPAVDAPLEVEAEIVDEQAEEPAPEAPTAEEVEEEVGKALALRDQEIVPAFGLPSEREYNVLSTLANRVYQTTFVPSSYRGREPDVFAAFLFGREIGLQPMMALRDVHMIDGRPALAAHRQLALLRQGGVIILESESTAARAMIKARRLDTGEVMTVEYTMAEAEAITYKVRGGGTARLVDKDNWRSYPADMLWARAIGRLTRRLGPDIAGGLPAYTAEEAGDFGWEGGGFGEGGEPTDARAQRQQAAPREMPAYRKEFPDYNWPSSMAEIRDRLGLILGAEEALEWLRQAREAMFPGVDTASYSQAQKDVLFQRLSSVLAALDGPDGPVEFELGVRAKVQAVFSKYLAGVVLDGPPWSIGPDEAETRPSKATPLEQPPEVDVAAAEEDGAADGALADPSDAYYAQFEDVDDIPFGPAASDAP